MPQSFDAIVFDMDGLLVDTEPMWLTADTTIIQRRGAQINMTVRAKTLGLNTEESTGLYRDHYQWDEPVEDLVDELHDLMVELITAGVKPLPGAQEMLDFVVEENLPRAIASSSIHRLINAVMDTTGWGGIFETRASSQDVVNGKPAPDVYLHAAALLGVAPEKCLALEDSPTGSKSATSAGMVCYAVPDLSHTDPSRFNGITPHVFADLHAVLAHLSIA